MLKTHITILIVLLALAVVGGQDKEQRERWVLGASTSEGTRLYFRAANRTGDVVTFSQATVTADGQQTYSEARVNCKKAMVSFRDVPTKEEPNPKWSEWADIFPGSTGDDLMGVVCELPESKKP